MKDMRLSLQALRVNKGMTQQDVADVLGVSRFSVMKWESDAEVKGLVVYALSKLYEVEIENIQMN